MRVCSRKRKSSFSNFRLHVKSRWGLCLLPAWRWDPITVDTSASSGLYLCPLFSLCFFSPPVVPCHTCERTSMCFMSLQIRMVFYAFVCVPVCTIIRRFWVQFPAGCDRRIFISELTFCADSSSVSVPHLCNCGGT